MPIHHAFAIPRYNGGMKIRYRHGVRYFVIENVIFVDWRWRRRQAQQKAF